MTIQQDTTMAAGVPESAMARLTRWLRELIELTGEQAGDAPVLELQLDGILTRTCVLAAERSLLIVALPPVSGAACYLPQAQQGIEYLWHADEGRHIALRRVPVLALPDERSVMDAILTTSDEVAAWSQVQNQNLPVTPDP